MQLVCIGGGKTEKRTRIVYRCTSGNIFNKPVLLTDTSSSSRVLLSNKYICLPGKILPLTIIKRIFHAMFAEEDSSFLPPSVLLKKNLWIYDQVFAKPLGWDIFTRYHHFHLVCFRRPAKVTQVHSILSRIRFPDFRHSVPCFRLRGIQPRKAFVIVHLS